MIVTMTKSELEAILEDKIRYAFLNYMPDFSQNMQDSSEDKSEFVTKREVAKMLSCSTSTVDNYRRAGQLKPYYLGQKYKSVRFKRAEVLALLEKE